MSKELHDIKSILKRIEIMSELLEKKDFSHFSQKEITTDFAADILKLKELFAKLSSGQ